MRLSVLLTLFFCTSMVAANAAERAFETTVTREDIQAQYVWAGQGGERVQVLVMPGHEPDFGGTELGGLKERDIMVLLGEKIASHLRTDPRIEVTIARTKETWHPKLGKYFEDEWWEIKDFVTQKKREMKRALRKGDVEERTFEVGHNTAATDVALRLYGINKWASERGFDIVIHPHLNDNGGAQFHSGFAVYVPDREYGNADASRPLGEAIAYELNAYNASSTLPIENYAIVEDQSLIALGAFNTADFASVLIEYAYIYESKIKNSEARDAVLTDMAYQTYRGIMNYLGAPVTGSNTLALPRIWISSNLPLKTSDPQVYALQVALKKIGFYPPSGELLIGCPISGYMGECTKRALKAFQASQGFEQTGTIGPKTKAVLESIAP
ncbi:MAG: peptidoglycan-binding domain-containing protein [Minisyncoccia bacterium]